MDPSSSSASRLLVWPKAHTLPSADFECLSALAYCKFGKALVKEVSEKYSQPVFLKHGGDQFPQLASGSAPAVVGVSSILDHVREMNQGADYHLSEKENASALAFISLLQAKLLPALIHTMWIDKSNYESVTRPYYARAVNFPSKMFLPDSLRAAFETKLAHFYPNPYGCASPDEMEKHIYQNAKQCLNQLCAKFGDNLFIFGDSPSSVDAYIFGYLAPILKVPFPKNELLSYLKECPPLMSSITHVLAHYFPPSPEDLKLEEERVAAEAEAAQKMAVGEYPNARRNTVFVAVLGLCLMGVYGVIMGIVRITAITVHDLDEEGEEEKDDDDL